MGWDLFIQLFLLLVVLFVLICVGIHSCIEKLYTQRTVFEVNQRTGFRAFRDDQS